MRPAADPAAQLVQLRQAEALRVLDEHDAGVRHVDPHLDHGGGDQDVQLPGCEGLHGHVAVVGALLGDPGLWLERALVVLVAASPCALAISVPVGFHGSVRLSLGRLAAVLGDTGAARDHLLEARRVHEELGLSAWVRRTDVELARQLALAGRGRFARIRTHRDVAPALRRAFAC